MKTESKDILANIIKIRNDKGLTQAIVAENIEVDYSTYSKLESGQTKLSIDRLEKIASAFSMEMIDILTYPEKYVPYNLASDAVKQQHKPKVILQIEVDEEKKEQMLKIAFGENNYSILNK